MASMPDREQKITPEGLLKGLPIFYVLLFFLTSSWYYKDHMPTR